MSTSSTIVINSCFSSTIRQFNTVGSYFYACFMAVEPISLKKIVQHIRNLKINILYSKY